MRMDAVCYFETLVPTYRLTLYRNPEDRKMKFQHCSSSQLLPWRSLNCWSYGALNSVSILKGQSAISDVNIQRQSFEGETIVNCQTSIALLIKFQSNAQHGTFTHVPVLKERKENVIRKQTEPAKRKLRWSYFTWGKLLRIVGLSRRVRQFFLSAPHSDVVTISALPFNEHRPTTDPDGHVATILFKLFTVTKKNGEGLSFWQKHHGHQLSFVPS
jgi:hypothetical protein